MVVLDGGAVLAVGVAVLARSETFPRLEAEVVGG
jgi:hypothetical protein